MIAGDPATPFEVMLTIYSLSGVERFESLRERKSTFLSEMTGCWEKSRGVLEVLVPVERRKEALVLGRNYREDFRIGRDALSSSSKKGILV